MKRLLSDGVKYEWNNSFTQEEFDNNFYCQIGWMVSDTPKPLIAPIPSESNIKNNTDNIEKRYQVFISSTYTDLKEERAKNFQTIIKLNCFPAGMEIFPAIEQDQFEYIKKEIDDSDYYLLIIGGRYGTLTVDGISYTEKEFDYAIDKKLKVIAFIHEKPEEIPSEKLESDLTLKQKLELFKKKVSSGRLVNYLNNIDDLSSRIASSLPETIKVFPAVGWIRANSLNLEDHKAQFNSNKIRINNFDEIENFTVKQLLADNLLKDFVEQSIKIINDEYIGFEFRNMQIYMKMELVNLKLFDKTNFQKKYNLTEKGIEVLKWNDKYFY